MVLSIRHYFEKMKRVVKVWWLSQGSTAWHHQKAATGSYQISRNHNN